MEGLKGIECLPLLAGAPGVTTISNGLGLKKKFKCDYGCGMHLVGTAIRRQSQSGTLT